MTRRPTLLIAVALALGALVVAALVVRPSGGDDHRAGSELVAEAGGPRLAITRTPASYRIVHRVESGPADRRVVSTDVLEVRRPFDSRLETRDGDTVEGAPVSVQTTTFGRIAAAGEAGQRSVLALPPGVAVSDLRVDAVLDAAVEAGALQPRERRRVAGRDCQVYRSAELLSAGSVLRPVGEPAPADAGGGDWADSCIDEAGLVLEEVLVAGGRTLLRRVATAVDEDVELAGDRFAVGDQTVPVGQGGGSVQRLAEGSRAPGVFWELDAPPAGWRYGGRYAVVPPQTEAFTDPLRRGDRVASVMDVLTRGPDLLVVEQGSTLGGGAPFDDRGGEQRAAGQLGRVQVLLTPFGPLVRTHLGGGAFVRVYGTVEPGELVALARRLRAVEGGELIPLDDPQARGR